MNDPNGWNSGQTAVVGEGTSGRSEMDARESGMMRRAGGGRRRLGKPGRQGRRTEQAAVSLSCINAAFSFLSSSSSPHHASRISPRPPPPSTAMKLSAAALSATLAALVGSTVAQLEIISPGGPDLWWVAESDNVVSWTCKTSTVQQFTVLIANQNTAILTAPQAFIAQQNNFDCSKLITKDQVNMQPGTGYTIQLANIFNETDVYAESQPFEIKALGAAYPATSATPTNSQSATGAVSGSSTATGAAASGSSTATGSNGARALGPSTLAFAGLAALGLVLA